MTAKKRSALDYGDREVREEILVRQRREMWTPEQIDSLSSHFRLAPGMALLDAGCGYGYSLRTFGPRCLPGGRLVGVDREPDLLETAARLAREEGLGDAATFRTGDIHALPFDPGTFDVVMVQVVLCHLAEPQAALDELIRVTARGGCVAVFDNAVGGCVWGWSSMERPTVKQMAARGERELLAHHGRKILGRGDWSVGLHVAAWMEARGMRDVDVRVNERAIWMAPPYRSPGQQGTVRAARDRIQEEGFDRMNRRNTADELRAAGADEATVRRALAAARRREVRSRAFERDHTPLSRDCTSDVDSASTG